jgi:hypothetical protein
MNSARPNFTAQLSYHSHLMAKLNLIVWAEGGKRQACRKMGASFSMMHRWLNGHDQPCLRSWAKIDARYFIAVEKRRIQVALRQPQSWRQQGGF